MRFQLYIGAVFFDRLNPPLRDTRTTSLIRSDLTLHDVYDILRKLIAQNNQTQIEPAIPFAPSRKHIQKDRA